MATTRPFLTKTLKSWLGFDDASVERTGIIDSDGYRGRLKLKAMWDDERPIDPQYITLAKFLFSYAYGTPAKHQPEGQKRESLGFLTTNGMVPWDPRADSMKDITDRMLSEKASEEKVRALEAAKKPEPVAATDNDSEAASVETLELVEPPPQDFTGGRR